MEMGRLYFDSQGANLNFHGNKPALCKPGNYFMVPPCFRAVNQK